MKEGDGNDRNQFRGSQGDRRQEGPDRGGREGKGWGERQEIVDVDHERFRSQRQIFLQCPGSKFWDKLDAALATIRKAAGGNAKKLSRAFRKVLDNDFKAHGSSSSLPVDVPEASAASTFQGEVDELITGPVRQSSPEM
ncbi:hypothetical protein GGX14DRAFT_563133 [Mycena pura]|uniref:Uncharacterized protein n=1 Tax=Mycena pura TaxID=153505 RepID=A0AAD6YDY9_9AGAR|nr:hypothetical protein GGX14DRAFT_563133 [Mycena pura]